MGKQGRYDNRMTEGKQADAGPDGEMRFTLPASGIIPLVFVIPTL
jgi:hypothetical protein